ncbi:cupin domain-containing protein [Streptomyces sp. NPDC003077]|uniref:JmjC domain-containing protein n=1 Tax=Streptomyces sp. NPDC003077 TaxID=3154443 RepID=UPI0033A14FD0
MRYRADPPAIELPETFYAQHWEREPLLLRAADPNCFRSVFTSAVFEELIEYGALRSGFVTVVDKGRPVAHELLCREEEVGGLVHDDLVAPEIVASYRQGGATVILAGIHLLHRSVADLVRRLEADVGREAEAHAFHTPPRASGLALHFDGEDNFLFQLEGTKHWTLAPPLSDRLPVSGGHPGAGHVLDQDRLIHVELCPGDLLYIPRGWLHASSTTDQASLHVTIQVLPHTVRDAISDRVRQILEASVADDQVVPGRGASATAFADQVRATARALEEWADELSSGH